MDVAKLEDMLAASLEDHRLSRGERKALRETLRSGTLSPRGIDHLRKHAFGLAREHRDDIRGDLLLTWLEDLMRLVSPSRPTVTMAASESGAWFSPGDECRRAIIKEFQGLRRGAAADVCVFSITDNVLAEAILLAARRGVRIRVISDNDKRSDAGSDVSRLKRGGVQVAVDQTTDHMHHKFAIFGNKRVLTGSYNWTRAAAERNHENITLSTARDVVRAFQDEFEALWRRYDEGDS